ncbi:hypothetical protein BU16DRAFT_557413 [Lophium mytilinum]|uniref:Uncharacterized protein n=1 Tax=Lophium mytilinum TaxID=390894 RepID=A0A6A6R575_9PEZI|nr:hypothetical protein BU16DRAFT_557413 [Lophium mytilinum]
MSAAYPTYTASSFGPEVAGHNGQARSFYPNEDWRTQQTQWDQSFRSDAVQSPSQQVPQHKRLSEMTENERFGLPSLLALTLLESLRR